MQCPNCGAILPDGTAYCYSCGARQADSDSITSAASTEASGGPTLQESGWLVNTPSTPPMPVSPIPALSQLTEPDPSYTPPPANEGAYREAGWAEFSGAQTAPGSGSSYPPVPPVPNNYAPPGYYPSLPGSMPPGLAPQIPPTPPKRRGPLAIMIVILVLLLVAGGVFAGIAIGQSHSSNTPVAQVSETPTASPTPNAAQLYQQVTSQTPTFTDSLQDPATSQWSVFEKTTYGCELKSDGLHIHINDPAHFGYCTSDRGKFGNFAFQIEMKILSGDGGGGITFRGDTQGGNFYYFHVYPDGVYHIYTEQNNQSDTELGSGNVSTFATGPGQTNTLTIIAQGDTFSFYANQKLVTQIHDSTYLNGYVGVMADDHTTAAEIVYTNMKLWVL